MNLWTERSLLEYQARSGEVRQIVSHPIAWADVWPDAIQENVLLILTLTETQVVFSLPIPEAGGLVGALKRLSLPKDTKTRRWVQRRRPGNRK